MTTYINGGVLQVFTSANNFASGGTVETYVAGTSTHRTTYPTLADALAGTNPLPWPVTLNARGTAIIAINGATDVIIKDSSGVVLDTINGIDRNTADVIDFNGNILVHYAPAAGAINYLQIANAASPNPVTVSSQGISTNVPLNVTSKGSGDLILNAGSTGNINMNPTSGGEVYSQKNFRAQADLTVAGGFSVSGNATLSSTTNLGTVNIAGVATTQAISVVGSSLNISSTTSTNFLPVGTIIMYAAAPPNSPDGWLYCIGAAVSRTQFAALFALIGTTYGAGDGSTTFNLPNLTRRLPLGVGGTAANGISNTVGSTGGAETVTLADANIPTNTMRAAGGISTFGAAAGGTSTVSSGNLSVYGSGTAVNKMPPVLVVNYLIRCY